MDINVAELIRMVLDALGLDLFYVPLPVWDVSSSGSKRSLVRRLGSQLPLQPVRRIQFRNELINGAPSLGTDGETTVCPNLSDLRWVYDDVGDSNVYSRTQTRKSKVESRSKSVIKPRPCTPADQMIPQPQFQPTPDAGAMEKINVLEDELSKLRKQIAMIVMLQEQSKATPGVPSVLPTPPNTPCGPPGAPVYHAPPPPPPPGVPGGPPPPPGCPPPPPPPPPAVQAPKMSAIDLIKKNKKNNASNPKKTSQSAPNMADVLKNLGTVKLRSINRSPGGTPMRQKPRETRGTDAASLIAQALKKKFAHRKLHSPDEHEKENFGCCEFTPSPIKKTPEFGQHRLKATGRRLSNITEQRHAGLSPLAQIN